MSILHSLGVIRFGLICSLFVVAGAGAPALADAGGKVLPADASVKGYSLPDAARATAYFNTGGTTAPSVPFTILTGNVTVKPGTTLYVPVFFADNNSVIDEPFPRDLCDDSADADYLLDAVDAFIGAPEPTVEALFITVDPTVVSGAVVDGYVKVLGDDYVAGVTSKLADGRGTKYIVSAAFLTPLTPGTHTVAIGGIIDGEFVVFPSYTVIVH